eukprot:IDg2602t1
MADPKGRIHGHPKYGSPSHWMGMLLEHHYGAILGKKSSTSSENMFARTVHHLDNEWICSTTVANNAQRALCVMDLVPTSSLNYYCPAMRIVSNERDPDILSAVLLPSILILILFVALYYLKC